MTKSVLYLWKNIVITIGLCLCIGTLVFWANIRITPVDFELENQIETLIRASEEEQRNLIRNEELSDDRPFVENNDKSTDPWQKSNSSTRDNED